MRLNRALDHFEDRELFVAEALAAARARPRPGDFFRDGRVVRARLRVNVPLGIRLRQRGVPGLKRHVVLLPPYEASL